MRLAVLGFACVTLPFGYAMGSVFIDPALPKPATDIIETRPEADYISYGLPLTVTLPEFGRTLSVSLSFMVDKGGPAAEIIYDQIYNRDGRMDATIALAIAKTAKIVDTPDDLRFAIGNMIRHEVNLQLGTDDNMAPVREVLITSYAFRA